MEKLNRSNYNLITLFPRSSCFSVSNGIFGVKNVVSDSLTVIRLTLNESKQIWRSIGCFFAIACS